MSERILIQELGKATNTIGTRLRESKGNGRWQATLIEAGWGSSGYYSEDCLRMTGHKAFPQGTHMYLDHSTEAEDRERPERSVRDLVGTVATMPRMEGIGLNADVQVYPHWQPVIENMAPDIGLSIRAMGLAEEGAAGGKEGLLIHELMADELNSVDYVTVAGAGGRLEALVEGARAEEGDWDAVLRESPSGLLVVEAHYEELLERDIGRDERIALAKKGQAIPVRDGAGNIINGRFPMATCEDVTNAAQSIGRGDADNASLKNFIRRVAKKLDCPTPFSESGGRDTSRTTQGGSQVADDERLKRLEESVQTLESRADKAEKERDEAKEQVAEATKRAERAEDQVLSREAEKLVDETLKECETKAREEGTGVLPERATKRVRDSVLRESVPTLKDGDDKIRVDEGKIKERVLAAEKDEREYLNPKGERQQEESPVREAGGSQPFGENDPPEQDDKQAKALEEALQRDLGLDEKAAKVAAVGR